MQRCVREISRASHADKTNRPRWFVWSQFAARWPVMNQSTLRMTYLNVGGQRWNHDAQNQDR